MNRPAFDTSSIPFSTDHVNIVIGPNGVGKTTLLNTLAGEYDAAGNDTRTVNPDVAYATQTHGLLDILTVAQQVSLISSLSDDPRTARGKSKNSALNALYNLLVPLFPSRVGMLSGGQEQLVSVWSTCTLSRSMYLFDEPLSGVDPANSMIVARAIASLVTQETNENAPQRTVILTLHDMKQIALFDDPWLVVLSPNEDALPFSSGGENSHDGEELAHPLIRTGFASQLMQQLQLSDNASSQEIFSSLLSPLQPTHE